MYKLNLLSLIFVLLLASGALAQAGEEDVGNIFDLAAHELRFPSSIAMMSDDEFDIGGDGDDDFGGSSNAPKSKSPGKAFLLSALVPGAGQWYAGSRVKPFIFLGAEAASWMLYFKYEKDGDDLTDEFEAFNRTHWSREAYEDKYLNWAYGYTDDDDVPIEATEISHHLPDTRTQQYYEMTGKYDQFAWGWDDATRDGMVLDDFASSPGGAPELRIVGGSTIPYSARRLTYETMRDDANKKYQNATNMVMVSLANHLISAFEAYFSVKAQNSKKGSSSGFGSLDFDASLKSYSDKGDTPFFSVGYSF